MLDRQLENSAFSFGNFTWWFGVVEDRMDPKKLGRLRVRIVGYHSADTGDIPKDSLFWAYPIQPITSAAMNGIGTSPTGIVEGTWVMGFFRDGANAQDPIVMGTIGGIPESKGEEGKGFVDPAGNYPKDDFLNEPDTNRLSRNEKIQETSIQEQRDQEDKKIKVCPSMPTKKDEWDEKTTEYSAKYPFNHVKETESGHIEEWDDTEFYERYRRWHRSGTFIEIHPEGEQVEHIVNDKYEIVAGDDYVHIKGECNVTIDNDCNLYVKGNCRTDVEGNYDIDVSKNFQMRVGGTIKIRSGSTTYIDASTIQLNRPGPGISFTK